MNNLSPYKELELSRELNEKVKRFMIPINGKMKVVKKGSEEHRKLSNSEFYLHKGELYLNRSALKKVEDEVYWQEIENYHSKRKKLAIAKYGKNEAGVILAVEKAWEDYTDNEKGFDWLFKTIRTLVQSKAKSWANYGKRWRLNSADFEEKFWDEVMYLADELRFGNRRKKLGDKFFYEAVRDSLDSRAKDLIRQVTRTKQGSFEYGAASLENTDRKGEFLANNRINVEKDVTNKLLIEQMLNNNKLTDQEKEVLKVCYENGGDPSFAFIAEKTGLKHKEKARRVFDRAKRKIQAEFN